MPALTPAELPPSVLTVGLTGGIGSGKSEVARQFAARGAIVIDSDQLAREVVEPETEGLAEVVATFGQPVLGPDGRLDRTALARIVFRDESARRRLEAIIHPRVRDRTAQIASTAPPGAILVTDVPLLVETGMASLFAVVVVVVAALEVRLARLVGPRGMSEEDARARIAAQATDEQRRAVADIVIVNDGPLDLLRKRADAAFDELLARQAALPKDVPAGRGRGPSATGR